VTLLSADAT